MRHFKILLITGFSKPWDDGWYYKAGFEINGHTVVPFDPALVANPQKRVFEITKEMDPDFILHTKDELSAEIFQELRRLKKVIQWYPDPVMPEWLPPYVEACDLFLTMSEGLVQDFRKYNPNSFWLSQAFEPSFFGINNISSEEMKKYSAEVTFVGNLGSKDQYLSRRIYLQRIIDEGFHLKWWGPRMPRKLSTIPLILGKLGRAYGGKFVWGEEHAKIAGLSKIYLGIDSQPHIRKSMSERIYIAVGCGAFYMCQHVEGIEEVLAPDKEIVTFRTAEEMIDKMRFYLDHDDARKLVAKAGQTRVLKDHTYKVRIPEMLRIIEAAGIL